MAALTGREGFLRTMRYQRVDRVPNYEMGLWDQTLDRWTSEGMPMVEKEEDLLGSWALLAGSDYFGVDRKDYADVRLDAEPRFSESVLEETAEPRIWVDREGSTRLALQTGEAHGVRLSMDTFIDLHGGDDPSGLARPGHRLLQHLRGHGGGRRPPGVAPGLPQVHAAPLPTHRRFRAQPRGPVRLDGQRWRRAGPDSSH